jgi:hypothetical protein
LLKNSGFGGAAASALRQGCCLYNVRQRLRFVARAFQQTIQSDRVFIYSYGCRKRNLIRTLVDFLFHPSYHLVHASCAPTSHHSQF